MIKEIDVTTSNVVNAEDIVVENGTVENMDDTTSYEEILYTLYLQFEVQKGIKDMENGKTKTTKQLKEIINKC